MPKRKRRRTRIKWAPILVIASLVSVSYGILSSPLTSLSKVYVKDAREMDKGSLREVFRTMSGIPWAMVNPRWAETRVQRIGAVDRAEYSQNLFGRGHLEVRYRSAVARVAGATPLNMDSQGVIYSADRQDPKLPLFVRPSEANALSLTVAGAWPAGKIAKLAADVRAQYPGEELKIGFNRDGALCLNIGTGLVIFGSCEDLEAKLRSLKEILEQDPGQLAQLENLNLTAPSAPAKTYKKRSK